MFIQKLTLIESQVSVNGEESKKQQNDFIFVLNNKNQLIYEQPVTKEIKMQIYRIFNPCNWNKENFEIGRRLGRGKYGYVYLVRQKQTKMIMALKILNKSKIMTEDFMPQVRRQIQIHSHLNHTNILKFYGFFYDQNRLYLLIEYATRGDLYTHMKKSKGFDEKIVKNYMRQIISAMIYLQSFNIIHRDIKPQNILISQNNTLKMSDFGLAVKSVSTTRNTFCGTMDYFCPEIVKYRPFSYKVDNWSLGILAYEFLTGLSPFYSKNKKGFFNNILYSEMNFPNYASQYFKDFVRKLTKKDAKERIQLSQALKHPWLSQQDEKMDIESFTFAKNPKK